jgi:hypothetical protein
MNVSMIYVGCFELVIICDAFAINCLVRKLAHTWAPEKYSKDLMLADIAILASIGDNLPLISAWIDAFQSELALDDETL